MGKSLTERVGSTYNSTGNVVKNSLYTTAALAVGLGGLACSDGESYGASGSSASDASSVSGASASVGNAVESSGRSLYSINLENHGGGGVVIGPEKDYFVADSRVAASVGKDMKDGYLSVEDFKADCVAGEYGSCAGLEDIDWREFTNPNPKTRAKMDVKFGRDNGESYGVAAARAGSDEGTVSVAAGRAGSDDGTVSVAAGAAAVETVPDFCYFADLSVVNNVQMTPGDNLMEDDGVLPPTVVSASHKIGFISYGPFSVDGCAKNAFLTLSGFEGWMDGDYSSTLGDGNKPDDMWIIRDSLEDGIGTYDSGTWTLGADDYLFAPEEVALNGTLLSNGGASELPAYSGTGNPDDLPSMTVFVPEPGVAISMLAGAAGLHMLNSRRKKKESKKVMRHSKEM